MTPVSHHVTISRAVGADNKLNIAPSKGIAGLSEHPFILDRAAEPVRIAQDTQLDGLMGPND